MKSMEMDKEEAAEQISPSAPSGNAPKYPYGLQISLDDSSLLKLGLKVLPKIGAKVMISAMCEVTAVHSHQNVDSDPESSVSLQITDMDLVTPKGDAAKKLYGKE